MKAFSTADLSDAAPQARGIELAFGNYGGVKVFSGRAVTIKCHEDNSLVKQAVGEAGEGRVLVVDGGGSRRRALLGDMLAEQAASNDATAVGVQALGTIPMKTEKLGVGQRDIPVNFGGVDILPGDYIYADNNGVLVSREALL